MIFALLLLSASLVVNFAEGKWDPSEFILVKAPRFDYVNDFEQRKDCIVNRCPKGLSPDQIYADRQVNAAVYSTMLHTNRLCLGTTVSSRLGWDWRMAPIIMIANGLGKDAANRPELREHWEVCLYDLGINIWHHSYVEGKQIWRKVAAMQLPRGMTFAANTPHELKVTLARDEKGDKFIKAECEGFALYLQDDSLPERFLAGINGCEGRNFFWDFKTVGENK